MPWFLNGCNIELFFNLFFFLILLFFLSCFSLGFSLFYSSFELFFWGCVWCVGFPSAARNHLCYELWVSHHHASGFSFCFALLLYMEVWLHLVLFFSPHDMFAFQQDHDSYLNVLQKPRALGVLLKGLADGWYQRLWFCHSCGFRGKGRGVLSSDAFDSRFFCLFISNSLLNKLCCCH